MVVVCVWKGKDYFENVRTESRGFDWEVEWETVRDRASQPVFLGRKRKKQKNNISA